LVGKSAARRLLGRSRRRRENNIKMDKMGECELNSSGLGHKPVEGSCEHGNETWSSIKGGEFHD
jgi:hypothetical protein